jgi:hypothetical protein
MRRVLAVLALLLASLVDLPAQTAASGGGSRYVLLFFDDLHIPFRSTPRMRDISRRVITRLMRQGDLWAVVSSGTSSVSQPLTSDQGVILDASRRIIGNLLPAGDLLAGRRTGLTPSRLQAEVRNRAQVAYATVQESIDRLAARGDRQLVVYYFSGGYDLELVPEPRPLIAAAWRAGVALHTFHIWEDFDRIVPPLPPGATPGEWDDYGRITMDSLLMMAAQTGGVAISFNQELEAAFSQLLP